MTKKMRILSLVVTPAAIVALILLLLTYNPAVAFQLLPSSSSSSPSTTTCTTARQRQHPLHGGGGVCKKNANDDNQEAIIKIDDTVETSTISRRSLIRQAVSSTMALSSLVILHVDTGNPSLSSSTASAKVVSSPFPTKTTLSTSSMVSGALFTEQREALLQAISNKSSDTIILRAIEKLIPLSPLKFTIASNSDQYASALDGTWKLLWYNKSDFSPLLKLPSPLRPMSYQYFGSIAEQEVGSGRIAQGLVGGVISLLGGDAEVWLSSGALPKENNPALLEIYPPFRFQLGNVPGRRSSMKKRTIVESQSDAEFRAANARSTEAQLAPKNEYEQLYLENYGPGSIRISVIAKGDPVIVGDMFVHQKL